MQSYVLVMKYALDCTSSQQIIATVNLVIFAGGKFRNIVGKTFHVGVIFTVQLIFPS